jgi:hypothetical protein
MKIQLFHSDRLRLVSMISVNVGVAHNQFKQYKQRQEYRLSNPAISIIKITSLTEGQAAAIQKDYQ